MIYLFVHRKTLPVFLKSITTDLNVFRNAYLFKICNDVAQKFFKKMKVLFFCLLANFALGLMQMNILEEYNCRKENCNQCDEPFIYKLEEPVILSPIAYYTFTCRGQLIQSYYDRNVSKYSIVLPQVKCIPTFNGSKLYKCGNIQQIVKYKSPETKCDPLTDFTLVVFFILVFSGCSVFFAMLVVVYTLFGTNVRPAVNVPY